MPNHAQTLATIIARDFGKPDDTRITPYLRLARRAAFAGSPAAFPACIRLAEVARARGWRRAANWMRRHMERRFGCYVHPAAGIGPGLRTPHPVAIVIGAGCRIGSDVTLYQNVTLGTSEQASYESGAVSYPTIGDRTILYAGAVVIGAIEIGTGVVVGANAVVTRDIPAGCLAVGVPAVAKPGRSAGFAPEPAPLTSHPAGRSCPR